MMSGAFLIFSELSFHSFSLYIVHVYVHNLQNFAPPALTSKIPNYLNPLPATSPTIIRRCQKQFLAMMFRYYFIFFVATFTISPLLSKDPVMTTPLMSLTSWTNNCLIHLHIKINQNIITIPLRNLPYTLQNIKHKNTLL